MSNADREWLEDLPLYAKQNREVFARFGLAMYRAQCLEIQIGQMAAIYDPKFAAMSPDERDRAFDEEREKMLGRLIERLAKRMRMPSVLRSRLIEAKKLRNWLAHRYFWERAKTILKPDGRDSMISELQEKADSFKALDTELTDFTAELLFRSGVAREEFESNLDRYCPGDGID